MFFLGNTFCSSQKALDSTGINVSISDIKIQNGIIDSLFITKDIAMNNDDLKEWNYNTLLYALFNNSTLAGNVDFSTSTVSSIRIKIKKHTDNKWENIMEIPINSNEDFNFNRYYSYCRGNTEYDFALVPVINQVEGNLDVNTVKSKFEGAYLIEKNVMYHAFFNLKLEHHREHSATTVKTLGKKTPYYIKNGNVNYTSGTLQAIFIYVDKDSHKLDIENWQYRENIDDFLTNGKLKLLKTENGKMWMIGIVDSISQDISKHEQLPIHNITWEQIGDADDINDLYENDFIDVL